MNVTRRSFLRYCTLSAAALGLDLGKLRLLEQALANPAAPSVVWLIGSACCGCSVSFLNRISDVAGEPADAVDVLAGAINVVYHPVIMSAAGQTAAAAAQQVYHRGNYVLVVEGAVPTAFGGNACVIWNYDGKDVTFQEAVQKFTARAIATVCVGTCSSFGGIPAAGSNPSGAMGVRQLTGRPTINISGCPTNPDWIVWAVVQLLTGTPVTLDADGRPSALYTVGFSGSAEPALIHDKCPRNPANTGTPSAANFGEDGHCLLSLGCRGPFTKSRCNHAWNGIGGHGVGDPHPGNWCIGVNAPCQGCVEKTFPGPQPFHEDYSPA
jgi:NiFe hydrogenase small subunit HydA